MPQAQLNWRLIDNIMAGTATAKELAEWETLTRRDPAYAALLPWLQKVQADQQAKHSPYYAVNDWQRFKQRMPAKPARVFKMWHKVAAAVVVLVALGWWLYPAPAPVVTAMDTYSVPNGHRQLVTLPDGTQIWINAGSQVKVPADWSTDSLREVWLEGEGFFAVQENPAQPFVVHTAENSVRVLGTSFNIEAYQHTPVAVTVATGKVRFSGSNGQSVTLSQNQRSVWIAGTFQTTEADAAMYNGWRQGVLQFNDEPLVKVLETLERRFNRPIQAHGLKADQYCTAKFAANESLDNILESFQHIYHLDISRKADTIFIQPSSSRK